MANKPEPGDYYILSAAHPTFALDANGNQWSTVVDGSNVTLWTRNKQNNQIWHVSYRPDNTLRVTSALYAKSLDIPAGNAYPGANVHVWTDNWGGEYTRAQQWDLIDQEETVTVNSVEYPVWWISFHDEPTLCLDISNASFADGTNIMIYTKNTSDAQKWIFVPIDLFHSGGLYEIRSMANTNLAMDVSYESTVPGANIFLFGAHGHNNQKWIFNELENSQGWLIRSVLGEVYLDTANHVTNVNGTNIETGSIADGVFPSQCWKVIPVENTVTINGKTCAIVQLGVANGTSYLADNAGGSTVAGANVRIWEPNFSPAQHWALYPTNAEDPRMPTPYGMGIASTLHGNIFSSIGVTGTNGAISTRVYPCWYSADAWATSGSNSFQWRWRSRKMKSSTSMWELWSDWTAWGTALVTREGARYGITDGLPVEYDLATHKTMQYQFEVRSCGVNELSLLVGPAASCLVEVNYKPTLTLTQPQWDYDGLTYIYTSDYKVGSVNVFPESILVDGQEVLVQDSYIVQRDDYTKLTIPVDSFATIPVAGSSIVLEYAVGTDRQYRFDGSTVLPAATMSYAVHTDAQVTYEESSGKTLTATVAGVDNVQMWMLLGDQIIECDRIENSNSDGASFLVPYPFGKPYDIFASGKQNGTWVMSRETKSGPPLALHAWNRGSLACVLECREREVLNTQFDIDSEYEQLNLNSRQWSTVRFANSNKGSFTAEGALVPGKTQSGYREFERLVGTKALYRSVTGDVVYVAVLSLNRRTTTKYTTVTVKMNREEK